MITKFQKFSWVLESLFFKDPTQNSLLAKTEQHQVISATVVTTKMTKIPRKNLPDIKSYIKYKNDSHESDASEVLSFEFNLFIKLENHHIKYKYKCSA